MNDLKIQGKAVPLNFGPIRGANGNARITGPCGDTMEFWVIVDEWRLHQVSYTTDGCAHSIYSGYAAATLAEGATVDQALDLQQQDVLEMLGGLPDDSRHCALLAANTLKAALHDYLKRQQQYLLNLNKETQTVRIAIPLANGRLCMHFGHCEQFALVEADEAEKKILGRQDLTPPPHEPGVLPKWLAGQGANLIIAGGMGARAQQLFAQSGIEVLVGAPAGTPEELVEAYLANTLACGSNVCDH